MVVAGDPTPEWCSGVVNIQLPKMSSRFDDAETNVRAALGAVDGWAYICHDDMIVTRPVGVILPANRGFLDNYRGHGAYYQRAKAVDVWLRGQGVTRPVNHNIHIPFLVRVDRYLELVSPRLPTGFGLSVYGNLAGLRTRWVYDPKVTTPGAKPHPSWPVWSLSDRTLKAGLIGRMLRDLFPTPGPYG